MGSRDRESRSFPDRLKELFKRKAHLGNHSCKQEYTLTQECLRDLSKESPLATRLKILREISPTVEKQKLADNVVEKIWTAIEDLVIDNATETRHSVFGFMNALVKGQSERLNIMRAQFFRLIKHHEHPEDIAQRLDLLISLTCNGKIILFFEEEIGRFLLNWLPEILQAGRIEEYLGMMDNVIRFNAAYIDEEVMNGFIQHLYFLCGPPNRSTTINLCLQIMSTIVAYSNMSPDALPKFIAALCRTVVVEKYCQNSWQIMKNLLGTHLGHSTIYTMCRILQESALKFHIDLLRGSIFFTRMGLWTIEPLPNLRCPPSSVLPSFLQAIKQSRHAAVAYEVILAIQQLINRCGLELMDSSWSVIVETLSTINDISRIELANPKIPIKPILCDTLNMIENFIDSGRYNGSLKSYYRLVEGCASDRPDDSILRLLAYQVHRMNPTEHTWIANLSSLLSKHFRADMRTVIRLKALEIVDDVLRLNRQEYEDELIEKIVIPHLSPVVSDRDILIRSSVIKLLVDLCLLSESKRCLELLDILEKFLFYSFENERRDVSNEQDFSDVKCLVTGLIDVFVHKIHTLPSSHAVKIYRLLVSFLEKHYEKPKVFENCRQLRFAIFECFLKMRADALYHLGYPNGNRLIFSSYLCVVYKSNDKVPLGSPPPQPSTVAQPPCVVTYVPLRRAFKLFITCLKYEKDWEVLNMVLSGMTKGLQNKSLILGKGNNELDLLVDVLCQMLSDRSMNLPETLNAKVSKPDFHSAVLMVLVNLTSYHSHLDQIHQQKLIRSLMKCMQGGPRTSKQCMSALTICTLEMKDIMVKTLPEVLLTLSKISATVHIAVPILEFLSTLTQLQMIYTNFVADQYMAVFAISLPYTNPFKYNHYIVSLAYHVIAVWFLKCRLPFRRDFVRFITSGLQANLLPFDDTYLKMDTNALNQDSSDRKRSSSLTEQGSRHRDSLSVRLDNKASVIRRQPPNKSLVTFYEELTETCIDLMARYAFSPCSALPKRLPSAEFLLNGGQSMCWIVGNRLVTITTSGCSQKVLKQGLCDKCWGMCSAKSEKRVLVAESSGSSETSRQNSNEKSSNSINSPQEEPASRVGAEAVAKKLHQAAKFPDAKHERYGCACWCQGWAEVYIRRPTGDMSWVMRIQNEISYTHANYEFPLNEISTLYMSSLQTESSRPRLCRQDTFDDNHDDDAVGGTPKQSPSRQNSQDSIEEELEEVYDDGSKSRNPVRRSNSSPEMSGGWKNPFHKVGEDDKGGEDKKSKLYSKDMRVSCEAIPEEIAGTTPPQQEPHQFSKQISLTSATSSSSVNLHPALLSHHSYPGSSPTKDPSVGSKPYQTVPHSPNIITSNTEFPKRPTNLPAMTSLLPLASKPPQSPTQTSPRLARHSISKGQEIQKSSSSSVVLDCNVHLSQARDRARERKNSGSAERLNTLDPNQAQKRDRLHTISVMSPATRKPRSEPVRHPTRSKEVPKSGINPSFVFLQLYHSTAFGIKPEKPLLVSSSDIVHRSVKILDSIPPYETHAIGVLYIRQGQVNNEAEILRNRFGSLRYVEFLQKLGTLVKISDVDSQVCYLGGLDQNGEDGKFAYIWQDDIVRITFHVATMMPNKESDPNCNNKKMHIGNDCVVIVYNESGEEYDISTIKSQFNFASIIIQPLDHSTNRVVVKVKDDLKDLVFVGEPKLVSDQNLAVLVRQLALHSNLASLVAKSLKHSRNDPYASNWLERLRKIKNVRNKVLQEQKNKDADVFPADDKAKKILEDFTDYT
ncbi:tuberin [Cylas formicarius]|uniref:tuberin n=1 Tax=Cylas formicarius TaxID=197179 RepID=UPI002958CC7F|nr:tuberin [Cylas formicarius]